MLPDVDTPRAIVRRNLFGGAIAWLIMTAMQVFYLATDQPHHGLFVMALETCFLPFVVWMTVKQARRAARGEAPSNDTDIHAPATLCAMAFLPILILLWSVGV